MRVGGIQSKCAKEARGSQSSAAEAAPSGAVSVVSAVAPAGASSTGASVGTTSSVVAGSAGPASTGAVSIGGALTAFSSMHSSSFTIGKQSPNFPHRGFHLCLHLP
eukprot:CAMPEP_0181213788 /NCGR_PEP_ID=MMETSP1096-20121128/25098_1 /TAXON_ID=156174 ORGANISM="Chrysochromulina ericina, Strain CCMP281" /NCGR_SAMPLE_ID=MMETSP1096 /ASSEMBLY_ACC=CAM_ASM_000453 /LENGTH=105 /DNA_ID=CAMNT_0023305463 /DNA_START=500 /DNA_END=818 /DNA_ORIENTATION=+